MERSKELVIPSLQEVCLKREEAQNESSFDGSPHFLEVVKGLCCVMGNSLIRELEVLIIYKYKRCGVCFKMFVCLFVCLKRERELGRGRKREGIPSRLCAVKRIQIPHVRGFVHWNLPLFIPLRCFYDWCFSFFLPKLFLFVYTFLNYPSYCFDI